MPSAREIIEALGLRPHPIEGGYFHETYRSAGTIPAADLPPGYRTSSDRSFGTAIYYLLTAETFSEMHRLPTEEVFHLYLGGPVRMLQLWPDGTGKEVLLGPDIAAGQVPQLVVPGGVWQGTRLVGESGFALLGCTVAPGFDYADYRSASRAELTAKWPAFTEPIKMLTPRG